MKKVTYKPKNDAFTGEVVLTIPSARQRVRYIKECNFATSDNGEVTSIKNIDALDKMYDVTEKHVEKVNLKLGKTHYKTFEAMTEDSDCDEIVNDLMTIVMQGGLGEG